MSVEATLKEKIKALEDTLKTVKEHEFYQSIFPELLDAWRSQRDLAGNDGEVQEDIDFLALSNIHTEFAEFVESHIQRKLGMLGQKDTPQPQNQVQESPQKPDQIETDVEVFDDAGNPRAGKILEHLSDGLSAKVFFPELQKTFVIPKSKLNYTQGAQ